MASWALYSSKQQHYHLFASIAYTFQLTIVEHKFSKMKLSNNNARNYAWQYFQCSNSHNGNINNEQCSEHSAALWKRAHNHDKYHGSFFVVKLSQFLTIQCDYERECIWVNGYGYVWFFEILFDFTTYLCWCICTEICVRFVFAIDSQLSSPVNTQFNSLISAYFSGTKFLAFDTRYYYYDHEMLMIIIYLFILTIPISWITVVLPFRFLYPSLDARIPTTNCFLVLLLLLKYKVKSLSRKRERMELPNRFALANK